MHRIGIDIGSTMTKVAVFEGDELVATLLTPTGFNSATTAQDIRAELDGRGYTAGEHTICATGYGRVSVPFADKTVTEITCHARGATWLFGDSGTVLDVGGQDTKVIELAGGKVKKFVMNDKCSAGTGKFLEIMANRMGVTQERLAELAAAGEPTTISSMCTVFAESEVISLIAQNKEPADIAHGIHEAIVSRAMSLIKRVGAEPGFMMTGGVAKNSGVVREVENLIDAPLYICEEPEIVGAVGAAVYGLDSMK